MLVLVILTWKHTSRDGHAGILWARSSGIYSRTFPYDYGIFQSRRFDSGNGPFNVKFDDANAQHISSGRNGGSNRENVKRRSIEQLRGAKVYRPRVPLL